MRSATIVSLALALAVPAAAQTIPTGPSIAYARAIAAGYKAAVLCSSIFNAGRTREQVEALELKGIYPEYDAIVPTLGAEIDLHGALVTVAFDEDLPPRRAEWNKGRGCTTMPIGAEEPVAGTHYFKPPGPAPADPRPWPLGDQGVAPRPSTALAGTLAKAFDRNSYGEGTTVGVVVVKDGRIIAERYGEGFGPFTSNRTWSAGKSMAGTLAGLAGLDPKAPARIANWRGAADPRWHITNDHLLRMASGLHSDTAGNRTDALYFGGTAVDEQAPGWPLEAAPGTRFRYANNDILLAMLSLRAQIGEQAYSDMPNRLLFAPLGMRHTVAEVDWRGNYILSSQVWSTARDFARLGLFWLQDGVWAGKRLLPEGWMAYMTQPSGPQPAEGPGYGATLWLFGAKQGLPDGSYAAQGNRGQYIMVVPSQRLVVVRRGEDGGRARFDIAKFTADVIGAAR
jgi:CubicO group peptidase (beta-lactamase class C family)